MIYRLDRREARDPRSLVESTEAVFLPGSWSPDGRTLALTSVAANPGIYLMDEGQEPRLFEADASAPSFSPDGRWIAYGQPAVGQSIVYVRAVEGPGKWQVSPELGNYPRWSARADEIFYMAIGSNERSILAVEVEDGEGFRFGQPRTVLEDTSAFVTSTAPAVNWDVDADGRRFVFVQPERGESEGSEIRVALGWGPDREAARAPLPD